MKQMKDGIDMEQNALQVFEKMLGWSRVLNKQL